MKKQSLVTRVMLILTGGDEGKISRFETKLDKYITKQIAMRNDQIETLNDKITDVKENLNDTILAVDLDAINTTEGAEGYCSTYVSNVNRKRNVIADLEAQVKSLQDEIKTFNDNKAAIYSVDEVK